MTILDTRQAQTGRSLINPELFARMSARITSEHSTDSATAARIVDQALAFLGTCAVTTTPLSPSKQVDIGWHTFILHTQEYAAFCDRVAGRFIHHVPTDGDAADCQMCNGNCDSDGDKTATTAWETTAAIVAAGYVVDAPMWEASARCSQCHNGCHNDPPPDPKAR